MTKFLREKNITDGILIKWKVQNSTSDLWLEQHQILFFSGGKIKSLDKGWVTNTPGHYKATGMCDYSQIPMFF